MSHVFLILKKEMAFKSNVFAGRLTIWFYFCFDIWPRKCMYPLASPWPLFTVLSIAQPDSLISERYLVMFQSAILQGQPGLDHELSSGSVKMCLPT